MTTYTAIANGEIDAESPITDLLLTRFRDNPIAIAEADPSAPATLFPTVLLGTINTTSGTTQTLSSLTLTAYRALLLVVQNVGVTSGAACNFQIAGAIAFTSGAGFAALRGRALIDLTTGVGDSSLALVSGAAPSSALSTTYALRTSLDTSATSISVQTSGTAFNAGSVRVYGVK